MSEKDNTFTLMNGTVLTGVPLERPQDSERPAYRRWPSREVQAAEEELFARNAHYLLENAPRIMADSRMFLAPVNIQSGMAYAGAFVKGLRELEGAKDLVFGGVVFKEDAPWQISYVWYPNESCRDESAVREPGYDEMLYRDGVETGWQTPDATGQEWTEVIARNSWAPREQTDADYDDVDTNVDLDALRRDFMVWKKRGVGAYLDDANALVQDPSKEWKSTAQSCTIYVLNGNPRLVISVKDDELLEALVPNGNTRDWQCDFSRGVSDVSRIMSDDPLGSVTFSEPHWQLRILHHPERPEYGRESDVKFTPALTPEEQQLADGIADELFKRRVCDDEED